MQISVNGNRNQTVILCHLHLQQHRALTLTCALSDSCPSRSSLPLLGMPREADSPTSTVPRSPPTPLSAQLNFLLSFFKEAYLPHLIPTLLPQPFPPSPHAGLSRTSGVSGLFRVIPATNLGPGLAPKAEPRGWGWGCTFSFRTSCFSASVISLW